MESVTPPKEFAREKLRELPTNMNFFVGSKNSSYNLHPQLTLPRSFKWC
jgi:hypothetical protein